MNYISWLQEVEEPRGRTWYRRSGPLRAADAVPRYRLDPSRLVAFLLVGLQLAMFLNRLVVAYGSVLTRPLPHGGGYLPTAFKLTQDSI
jgi:hypothetical protein